MFGQDYEPAVASFLQRSVRPGDVIFDVGANVGVYVLQLGRWTSGRSRIVAFEPNPAARSVLERHVAMNFLADSVLIVPSAVASEAGPRVLWASGEDGMARLGQPNALLRSEANAQTVSVTTLDSFVAASGIEPRWVLMDVEGFEISALGGAKNLIKRMRGRLGFVIELHPQVWDMVGTPRRTLEELISELKLKVEPITGQNDPLGEYGHVLLS
jgi:FkbM family methyltransferase